MKSRPESRKIFSSPSLFYRVLHILSTQRYRLPVRRYILDLFEISLDRAMVRTLTECGKALTETAQPSTSPKVSKIHPRVSVFGNNKMSESDEEEELVAEVNTLPIAERPLSLHPAKRVVGFDAIVSDSDSD